MESSTSIGKNQEQQQTAGSSSTPRPSARDRSRFSMHAPMSGSGSRLANQPESPCWPRRPPVRIRQESPVRARPAAHLASYATKPRSRVATPGPVAPRAAPHGHEPPPPFPAHHSAFQRLTACPHHSGLRCRSRRARGFSSSVSQQARTTLACPLFLEAELCLAMGVAVRLLLLPPLMAVAFCCYGVSGRSHFHKKPPRGSGGRRSGGGGKEGSVVSSPVVPPADDDTQPVTPQPPTGIVPSDPATPDEPCVFDVRAYGAVGDGTTDDTQAFREAWKAACASDFAVLLVPSDGTFTITTTTFSGPCKPGLVFQVDGVLMPPDGPDCWPASDNRRQWVVFSNLDGMTLRGSGTIEGNGEDWWNLPCKPHRGPNGSTLRGPCDSPTLVRFFMSRNLVVEGLRVENSPEFHFRFDGCSDVRVDGLYISSPANSPNTDGIHVENTERVAIYNSRISNGDDCISIGTGSYDVDIQNVTCGPGHGISIGSLGVHNSQACVANVTVRNAVIRNSDNGLRIKTWQGGMGAVSGITFDTVVMENVRNCIIVDQYYCLDKRCMNQSTAVHVTDVSYTNVRGSYDVRAAPIHFACSDTVPCTNITMSEVELLPASGELVDDPFCWSAYGTQQTPTIPPITCLQEGLPDALLDNPDLKCR